MKPIYIFIKDKSGDFVLAMLEDYEKLYIMKSVVFYTIIKDEKVC
ncbi:hypothetical protein [Clostridium tertium]|nr:hypothetical protein [Clostridium tertium]MBP1867884.1 hypothetical protein [Clostridium tertium]